MLTVELMKTILLGVWTKLYDVTRLDENWVSLTKHHFHYMNFHNPGGIDANQCMF